MTWQRIDENTFIDNTLITCAEYQIFIDEMRDQGKYYQPDHWTSYQFPEGMGMEPILGVRFDDAKVFCKWLIKQETNEWSFRLPTTIETRLFPLTYSTQAHMGFWVTDPNGNDDFAWIGTIPNNPRHLSREQLLSLDIDPKSNLSIPLNIEKDFRLDQDFERNKNFMRARANALNRDQSNDNRYQVLEENFRRLHRTYTVGSFLLAFFTLLERIAGRSPAFEGIRLVKERIR